MGLSTLAITVDVVVDECFYASLKMCKAPWGAHDYQTCYPRGTKLRTIIKDLEACKWEQRSSGEWVCPYCAEIPGRVK